MTIIAQTPMRYIERTVVWSRTQYPGDPESELTQNVVLDVDTDGNILVKYDLFAEILIQEGWSLNPNHPETR